MASSLKQNDGPEMGLGQVWAVVVTYHPDGGVRENLIALRSQVAHVVVVDNGSAAHELALIQSLAGEGLEVISNGTNLGIATALNIGIRRATEAGAGWLLLFDQDSHITGSFVATMLQAFASSPWGAALGVLVPIYTDARLGRPLPANHVQRGLEAAMTSGSMVRAETFSRCGLFVEELFIDGVDYEFSLRLRRQGYVIDECPGAVLLHSPGEPRRHRLLGFHYQTANYSPIRRYYQERNKIWIAKRYALQFPVFCFKLFFFSSKDFIKILVAEDNRMEKARYFLRGVFDGVRERMGKLQVS